MRTLRTLIATLFVVPAFIVSAQSVLEVEVVLNKPKAGGKVSVALCPGKAAYDTETGCTTRTVNADAAVVRVTFTSPPEGELGIKAFHDINGNGTIDTNWMGIPNEPYGFGNSAPATFGPPSFEKAAVVFKGGKVLTKVTLVGG